MKFATSLTLGVFSSLAAIANAAADGLLCVDQDLIDVFAAINAIRTDMTSAAAYVALNANADAYDASTRNYWVTSDTTQEAIISGEAYLTAAVSAVSGMTAAIDPFTWAEGLADATELVSADYTAT